MHRRSPAKAEAGLAGAAAGDGEVMGGLNVGCEGRKIAQKDQDPSSVDVFEAIASRVAREESMRAQQTNETIQDLYREGADFATGNRKSILDDSSVCRGEESSEGEDDFDAMVDLVVGDNLAEGHGEEVSRNDDRARHDSVHELSQDGGILDQVKPMSSDEWDSFMQNVQRLGGCPDSPNNGIVGPAATVKIAKGCHEGQVMQKQPLHENVGSSPALLPNAVLSIQSVEIGTSAPELPSSNVVPSKHLQLTHNNWDSKGEEESDSRDATEQNVPLRKSGETDLGVDSFLQIFSSLHNQNDGINDGNKGIKSAHQDQHQCQQVQGLIHTFTLRYWMEKSRSRANSGLGDYVRMALPVALKLTEGLMEMEGEGAAGPNLVPLASISVENILIRLKSADRDGEELDIDGVLITSNLGNSPDIGTVAARLLALGKVLYELFSGKEPPACTNVPPMINSVNLDENHSIHDSPWTKKRASDLSDGSDRLESSGLPYSLRALVKNLLDYSLGDLCGDDTYTSLADVRTDLLLMIDDPSRFLDDIETNPLPSLMICNKLYGREIEVATLERCHGQHISCGSCSSIFITGEGGVGKSNLAVHLAELSGQANGYFLAAKFDQNTNSIYPLATIASIFNSLCDLFALDANSTQLGMVNELLTNALGSEPTYLAGILPSLGKIMPSSARLSSSLNCIDPAMILQFQFGQLLSAISSQSSRPITMLFDDLHWADSLSLMLMGSLVADNERSNNSVFLTFCYREEEVKNNEPFQKLLESVSGTSVETIKLDNMNVDGVNSLLSDSLHISPRLTRPLAWVLYHKTRGNPLFLRQLLESLTQQGCIYVDLKGPRWKWNMDQITDLQISDDVVAFLIKEMQRLPAQLQLGLQVCSCLGEHVKSPVIAILSKDLDQDLLEVLNQVALLGYLDSIDDGAQFSFAHDMIQRAAYKMMTDQKRKEHHMRFGLAIYAHSITKGVENDELFFVAVNQINEGGPGVLPDPSRSSTVAALNLKAGKRATTYSDFNAAFQLYKHGISFLTHDENHWETQYNLSLDLFDAASDAACIIDDRESVTLYTEQLMTRARCYDDKLNCLYAAAKALTHAVLHKESMEATLVILGEIGEPALRPFGELSNEIRATDELLRSTTDESIYNMRQCTEKKHVVCQKLYVILLLALHFVEPALIPAASLQMVKNVISFGLTPVSPLAFSYYGATLAAIGQYESACRLGGIALKLLEHKESSRCKASVILTVNQLVLWSSSPLQAIVDAHDLGHKAGMQSGDIMYAIFNRHSSTLLTCMAGYSLAEVKERARGCVLETMSKNIFAHGNGVLLYIQACALVEGLHVLAADRIDDVPGLKEVLDVAKKKNDASVLLGHRVISLSRAFLFGQLEEASLDANLSDLVFSKKVPLRPLLLFGLYYEALISFQFARQSNDTSKWMAKGEALLQLFKSCSENCPWNWENKMLVLEAERMAILGQNNEAESLYIRSIRSAKEHRFINEQGIASELAGMFFYERGFQQKAYLFLKHSIDCYNEWGALAVSKRVEDVMNRVFGPDLSQLDLSNETMESIFIPTECSKKRQGFD